MSADETAVEDVAPPTSTLPDIAGITPKRLVHRLSGSTELLQQLYDVDAHMVLLVEVDPGGIALSSAKEVLTQTLDAAAIYDVTDLDGAKDLLRAARSAHRKPDPKIGHAFLPYDDTVQPAGVVDASGVVLTLAEVAEARGFDVDPDGDSLTVEFVDGTRGCWPDDWAGKGQTLAAPGGFMRLPGDGPTDVVQVVRLLDLASAEVVAEWTPEDEEARLLAAERDAELAEAAEDRAAVDELEAGRTLIPVGDGDSKLLKDATLKEACAAIDASSDVPWLMRLVEHETAGKARKGLLATAEARLTALVAGGGEG